MWAVHILLECFHYYHPQTKFAKVMFSQVSVCMCGKGGMHGWGGMAGGGMCGRGGMCGKGACVARGCVAGGMHGRGCAWQEGHAWQEGQPLQQAVRILLECIPVYQSIYQSGRKRSCLPNHCPQLLPQKQYFFNSIRYSKRNNN